MSMRLNREAYQRLVDGNIDWLNKMPRTLERDHILEILKRAVDYEYGPESPTDHEHAVLRERTQVSSSSKVKTMASVRPIRYLNVMQAMALSAIGSAGLKWRHAGLGVIQAYLFEGTEYEVRLHIWHPKLKKEGMSDHGDIHDHRFTLRSHVLLGEIKHTEYTMFQRDLAEPVGMLTWRCHSVTHAREAEKNTGTFHQTGNDEFACGVLQRETITIQAGNSYTFPKREFHKSEVDDLTITLVEKLYQDNVPARVLSRLEAPVVHAFTDTLRGDDITPYLVEAHMRLGTALDNSKGK